MTKKFKKKKYVYKPNVNNMHAVATEIKFMRKTFTHCEFQRLQKKKKENISIENSAKWKRKKSKFLKWNSICEANYPISSCK